MGEIKIIGGEFEIPMELYKIKDTDVEFAEDSERNYYATGRTCLYAILRSIADASKKRRKILMPDYICTSVTKTVKEAGWDFTFYQIKENLLPDEKSLSDALSREKIVLLVNYFGMLDLEKTVSFIRSQAEEVIVIVDNVQNYYGFRKAGDFDYTFTSFRKWFPVPDGAEVLVKKRLRRDIINFENQNEFAKYKFAGNILKNFRKEIDDSLCLELIERGERLLDRGGISAGARHILEQC